MSLLNNRTSTIVLSILKSYSTLQLSIIGAGFLLATLFAILPYQYNISEIGSVLTALAIIQASILGIVFSVSILGVQLIADRYSPRMMRLITSASVFRGLLILSSVSIGFDLWLALYAPSLSPAYGIAGVAIAGSLAVAVGIGLWQTVKTVIDRSTPNGILDAYANDITPAEFRESVRRSQHDLNQHPLHDLHELIMAALSRREWSTVKNGIKYTHEISTNIIEAESEGTKLRPQRDELAKQYFRDPLKEQLPRAAQRAHETEQKELASNAIEAIETIGKSGIDNNRPYVVTQGASGLGEIFREAPAGKSGQSIREGCLDACQSLLTDLMERPASTEIRTNWSLYTNLIRIWLIQGHDPWEYELHLRHIHRECLANGIETYLNYYGDYFDDIEVDWKSTTEPEDHIGVVKIFHRLIRSMVEVNFHIFNYIDNNEEWPIAPTQLQTGMYAICSASEKGPPKLTRTFLRYYIDSAYVVYRLDSEKTARWARTLARLKSELENEDVVDEAMRKCAEKGMTPWYVQKRRRLEALQEPESTAQQFYQQLTDGNEDYAEWLESFSGEVDRLYAEHHTE